MFGNLRNGSFEGKASLVGRGIEEYRKLETNCTGMYVLFWLLWVVLTVGTIVAFYITDNKWLED